MKKNIKHLSLQIDEETLCKFDYIANRDDRSMNRFLLHMIKSKVAKFEEQHGQIPEINKE